MLYSITALVVLFVLWASLFRIEEITRGAGQVVPSSEVQVIQSLEGGILSELLVNEGDRVEKDQVLARIKNMQFSSQERGAEARAAALHARKIRLEAEAKGAEFIIPEEIRTIAPEVAASEEALYHSRMAELANALSILENKNSKAKADLAQAEAETTRLGEAKSLLEQQLAIVSRLVEKGAVSKLEDLRLRVQINNIAGQLNSNQEQIVGLKAEVESTEHEIANKSDQMRSEAYNDLAETEASLAELRQNLVSMDDRVSRTELRAPVAGIVNNITLKTIGGVIEPAHKFMEIVPVDDELKIIARVLPQDIAFLKLEQPVKVRISAYDSQRYGTLEGKLMRIGAGSIQDEKGNPYFEIEVRTDKNILGTVEHSLPVTPGMVAETDIITGKRTIMTYLLKPAMRLKDRALSER